MTSFIQWYTFDVFKKLNYREVIFYMLATAEFTFLNITFQIKVHHTINSVSEAMKWVVSVRVCVKYAYLNMQIACLESHF